MNREKTRLLASHCACCMQPLTDSKSIELGIGPMCRKRHGFNQKLDPRIWDLSVASVLLGDMDDKDFAERQIARMSRAKLPSDNAVRIVANECVQFVAFHRTGRDTALVIRILDALSLKKLASILQDRRYEIVVEETSDNRLSVKAPFSSGAVTDWRDIPSRQFDKEAKRNVVRKEHKLLVWNLLKKHHAGCAGIGPKGEFTC